MPTRPDPQQQHVGQSTTTGGSIQPAGSRSHPIAPAEVLPRSDGSHPQYEWAQTRQVRAPFLNVQLSRVHYGDTIHANENREPAISRKAKVKTVVLIGVALVLLAQHPEGLFGGIGALLTAGANIVAST